MCRFNARPCSIKATSVDDKNNIIPDAVRGHWVERLLSPPARPYARLARLERPIGWWLLLIPCWWSSALASDSLGLTPNPRHLALFVVGAIAMRGAGCTYNDIVDRDLDAAVARTRTRPIPSGQVSVQAAVLFLVLEALIGLFVLTQFNNFTIGLGVASMVVVAVYPFLKRVTWWPQVGLGLAFSWGALMGWSAIYGSLGWAPLLLYAGAILWTTGYDTIYAHQDKEDDALIGVRSTARLFGENSVPIIRPVLRRRDGSVRRSLRRCWRGHHRVRRADPGRYPPRLADTHAEDRRPGFVPDGCSGRTAITG